MYVVKVEGEKEQTVDLAGLYRLVARINPLDDSPMNLDPTAVTKQMTCPKDSCLLPVTTRDALHTLVWGAAAGKITTHRFMDGPVVAVRVIPGTEYQQPPREFGQVKSPIGGPPVSSARSGSTTGHRSGVGDHERRFGFGVNGRR